MPRWCQCYQCQQLNRPRPGESRHAGLIMYPMVQRSEPQDPQQPAQDRGAQARGGQADRPRPTQLRIAPDLGRPAQLRGAQEQDREQLRAAHRDLGLPQEPPDQDVECQEGSAGSRRRHRPLYRRVFNYVRQAWTGVKSALGIWMDVLCWMVAWRMDSPLFVRCSQSIELFLTRYITYTKYISCYLTI